VGVEGDRSVGGDEAATVWAQADLVTPMAIRVAATLRIADHIAASRGTTELLAAAAGVNADALERVLRRLVEAGVFTRNDAGEFGLTPVGESLRDDHRDGDRDRLDIEGAVGRADLSLAQLLHAVRTGEAAYPAQFGRSFWEDLAADPELGASYAEQMAADVTADAPHIVAAYDWEALRHVVDVGGGNGALLLALLQAFPELRGTVVDLPSASDAARSPVAKAGFAARCEVVAGSFFDPLPPGAGGYVLSAIVHDWDDEAAVAILRRSAEAAGSDGRVFVVEKIGADGRTIRTGMDLRVLAYMGGKERTVPQLSALAARVGLDVVAVHPADNLSVVELAAQ
jgi:predicted transcriptional regulator